MYCINYVVQKGDTLYSISRHFNIELGKIIDANQMVNVYNLRAGETICIPVSVPQNNYSNDTTYMIKEGDTLGSVLERGGINLADLLEFNHLNDIYLQPGRTLQVPMIGTGETE